MNIIDKKFKELTDDIKDKSEIEIFYHIKERFLLVNEKTRQSCENFFNKFLYWGKLDIKNKDFEFFELKAKTLKNHIEDFIWLYDNLCDYQSKKVLLGTLDNWYNWNFTDLASVMQNLYDDYFDLDLIPKCEAEVFVDLGAYIGDSTLSFIKNYGTDSYNKIYCYEISKENFEYLKTNLKPYEDIDLRLKGVSAENRTMYLKENGELSSTQVSDNGDIPIQMVTLDDDIKEEITIIKSDIEGAEKMALMGAKGHIMNEHPKLLISIYHSNDDVWQIPRMIKEMDESYRFYLRYHGGMIYPTEITLIAL